ncbi:RING/U-box superfamily protein [Striga asiatica]|uniref:RING/U-box superfamily protein n=1 Tax=Striga asiatica TaxID=4170 RepID=A0A5A7QPF4_STRAF|nr:RING/U-box superfamily protein [Striga asiatica]
MSHELDKYSTRPDHVGPHDCAICLCSIEQEDDKARELNKCRHVFHGACIERWVTCGHWTCPICRSHIKFSGFCGVYEEIVVLGFVDSRMSDEENEAYNWWLR